MAKKRRDTDTPLKQKITVWVNPTDPQGKPDFFWVKVIIVAIIIIAIGYYAMK